MSGKTIKAKNVSHGGATERVTWEMLDNVNPELAAIRDVTKITLSFDSIASLPICADGCADAVQRSAVR